MRVLACNCLLLALFALFVNGSGEECVDGDNNVVVVHDIIASEKRPVRFNGVKLHTYGPDGKPSCQPEIHIPGYVKLAEGEIEVAFPVSKSDENPHLDFTIEQNSFMVGKVCQTGKSKNSFVPDEVCSLDLCSLAPDVCKLIQNKVTLTTADLPEAYNDLISIGPIAFSALEGEWKASAHIVHKGKQIAGIRLGEKTDWLAIKLGDEHAAKVFEKTEKTRDKTKKSAKKEEL